MTHFEQFWKSYPRRVARKDAVKAWGQVQGDKHINAILEALEWQRVEWADRLPAHIAHPASYLRGERWTDEPELKVRLKLVPDWTEECRTHHGLTCDSRYQHGLLMDKEQTS